MAMPKRAGIIFVTMGAVLILSALLLLYCNGQEARQAGEQAELLLEELQAVMAKEPEETGNTEKTGTEGTESTDPTGQTGPTGPLAAEMPVEEIDGYGYIGYLSIPELELQLPVMSEWDYERLKIAPCRQFGSSRTDDLVIAAHNYKTHFGELSTLEAGTEIQFTDMEGIENCYELQRLETVSAEAVDAVQNSGYDLVLYTCTPGGATRLVAFCDRSRGDNG